jgi:UDP-GlcNAc:undecaprenyl-phosphate GlcNAc-1-phosphate transferase
MREIAMPHMLLLSLPTALPDIAVMLLGGACAFLLTYLLTFGVIALCRRMGWLGRQEAGRTRDMRPRLGGIAMFLAFVIASLLFYSGQHVSSREMVSYWLLLGAALLIVAVHAYDDVKGLGPLPKLLAQTMAVIIVMGPGWNIVNGTVQYMFQGVLLFGFSNPFGVPVYRPGLPWYREPVISLFIHRPAITWLAIPAMLFTWFWIVGMMNTVNLVDGLDGLATGVVAITALFITIISWVMGQHSIAILGAIFTGAVLGFLPHNWNPAKILMGDSGSQFLGLGLAVLSIIGGAKVALALMLLGIPILDVAVVAINRIRHGQHPLHYDNTHMHYRLLATGLSVKQICYVFYGLTFLFGVLALNLPHIYKLIGMGVVGLAMVLLIVWVDYRQRKRGMPIKPADPAPEPPTDGMGSIERASSASNGSNSTPIIETSMPDNVPPDTIEQVETNKTAV